MSQTLKIPNFGSANIKEVGELNADANVSDVTLTLRNTQGYALTDALYLGRMGAENGEVVTINDVPNGTTIGISAPGVRFYHRRYDTVHSLFGTQLRIYRAPNVDGTPPATDAFAILATVPIDVDQAETQYIDSAGGADFWYRFAYYNAASATQSNLTDSTPVRGGAGRHYTSLDAIRREAGFGGAQFITDDMIDSKRQAAEAEINNSLSGLYTLPFVPPINPFIADVATRLAAGLLLLEQYGAYDTNNNQNGRQKVEQARADIAAIKARKQSLVDANGVDTALPGKGSSGYNAWPNRDTAGTAGEDGGGQRMFRVSDRY